MCACKLHTKRFDVTRSLILIDERRGGHNYVQINTSDNADVDERTEQYQTKTNTSPIDYSSKDPEALANGPYFTQQSIMHTRRKPARNKIFEITVIY